jgi:hypothetical protein
MTNMIVEIMVEVLTILAITTEELKCGQLSERIFTAFLTDTLFREVLEEADGRQRHRGWPGEVGQINARRGTNGICEAAEYYSQRRRQSDGGE